MAILHLPPSASTTEDRKSIPSAFEEPCRRAVEYSLANFLYEQACFFGECLVAERPCDDHLYLLATAYVRSGSPGRAYVLLEERQSSEQRFRYLLALCCFKLEKFEETERVLLHCGAAGGGALPGREVLSDVAGGAAGLYLLGQVREKRFGYCDQAIESYAKCLELCPFMWCAFERLSWLILGAASAAASSGAVSSLARTALEGGAAAFAGAHFSQEKFAQNFVLYPDADCPSADASVQAGQRSRQGQKSAGADDPATAAAVRKRRRNEGSSPAKYSGEEVVTPLQPTSMFGGRTPLADRSALPAPPQSPAPARSPAPAISSSTPVTSSIFQTPVELLSRLSPRRLLSYPCSPARSPDVGIVAAAALRTPAARECERSAWTPAMDAVEEEEPVDQPRGWTLAALLRTLGDGLHALHRFDCARALEAFRRLPARHYNSGFVQDYVGRCHFESADYKEAATVYAKCCEDKQLHRPLGLEYYSTALWHLRDATSLGYLSRRVLEWDRMQPQAWCVVGNCFSLQRDHEQAIRCFRRAVQLNPSLTYGYTLIAHEFTELEKLDKASEMFKHALSVDARHYNAWWGLGNLYLRQEEFENARYHFQRAVDINSGNVVLRISLGQACVALNEPTKALESLEVASQMPHGGAAAALQKGSVLALMGRHIEAIDELQRAQNLAPREPSIKYELGRAYASVGDTQRAFMHFSMALDLCGGRDSKDYQVIVGAQMELQNSMGGNSEESMMSQEVEAPGTPVSSHRIRGIMRSD